MSDSLQPHGLQHARLPGLSSTPRACSNSCPLSWWCWCGGTDVISKFMEIFLQFSSVAQSCPMLCDPMNHSIPGLPVHHLLPESTQTHVHWVSDTIQPSHPLSSHSPPAFNLSQNRVFSNESALRIRWPKYWSFSFSISPSSEYSGLISSRIDWFDLLVVQGTLKSLLQHHSSKAYLKVQNKTLHTRLILYRMIRNLMLIQFVPKL